MQQRFNSGSATVTSPATGAWLVSPSDTTDLPEVCRMITIGTATGAVSFIGLDGQTYTTGDLPIGSHPMIAKRIMATGTTATGITAWA